MTEQINKKYLKEKQYKSTKYLEARIKFISLQKIRLVFMNGYLVNMIYQNLKKIIMRLKY